MICFIKLKNYILLLMLVLMEFSAGILSFGRNFPKGFLFGTATSSYQIEGAWDIDGKSVNIWDDITHTRPDFVTDGSNGDISVNSYYLYKRDVQMLRELGVDIYRFSISWTRILPTSFPDQINEAGVEYYNNLIDELLKYNIQPIITLYHWDLPLKLQQLGGWANPYIIDYFADYARIAFELFGDRVKYWITINEPQQICYYGYGETFTAPALNISGVADYLCAKNLLLAHAKAYHIYDREFRSIFNGTIFISLSAQWYEPKSMDKVDFEAAHDANQFHWGQYFHPIFSRTGDFPQAMKERIGFKSAAQGFLRSRLPEFTSEEITFIQGSSDLLGLNHYFTYYVTRNELVYYLYKSPSFLDDLGVITEVDPKSIIGESKHSTYVPRSFYKLLRQIKKDYDNPPILITENGFATLGGLRDHDRITYFKGYLSAMLDAIQAGSDIRGYTAWTLMDNFEWFQGYTQKFGLYEVDFSSVDLKRTARLSAFYYKRVIQTHALELTYTPISNQSMSIDEGH